MGEQLDYHIKGGVHWWGKSALKLRNLRQCYKARSWRRNCPNSTLNNACDRLSTKTAADTLKPLLDGQCYCLELIVRNMILPRRRNIIVQYFILLVRLRQINTLSDTGAPCVAVALALCLKKKKKILRWTKEGYKPRPQHTHTHKSYDILKTESAKRLQNCLRLDGPPFAELLEIFTPITAKRSTCKGQSLSRSFYPLR
jgi:hypothetical protein